MQDCGARKAGDHNYALKLLGEYESNDSEGQSDDSEGASHPTSCMIFLACPLQ